jgi:hypothetical protein
MVENVLMKKKPITCGPPCSRIYGLLTNYAMDSARASELMHTTSISAAHARSCVLTITPYVIFENTTTRIPEEARRPQSGTPAYFADHDHSVRAMAIGQFGHPDRSGATRGGHVTGSGYPFVVKAPLARDDGARLKTRSQIASARVGSER